MVFFSIGGVSSIWFADLVSVTQVQYTNTSNILEDFACQHVVTYPDDAPSPRTSVFDVVLSGINLSRHPCVPCLGRILANHDPVTLELQVNLF